MPSHDLKQRIEAIETGYEFMLAYAAQGLSTDAGSGAGGQVRGFLGGLEAALDGLGNVFRAVVAAESPAGAADSDAFIAGLDRDAQIRAEIDALCHFVDTQLRSPHGGVHEGLPVSLPRRQNPHMHLFESMIAAFDATHDLVFQNRAGDFFALFLANLYDKQRQVLGEYFEEDFSKIEPVSVEPGHQAEWTWLLKGFERITGCPTGRYRGELLA